MEGLSIVRQHLLTAGRKEDPRHAGRKEIQEEWERVSGVRYHTPKKQLIYWMTLQTHLKVVFSFKMKLPELWKFQDLLERPTKIKDACLSVVGGIWSLFSSLHVRTHRDSCRRGWQGSPPTNRGLAGTAHCVWDPSCRCWWLPSWGRRGLLQPAYGPLLASQQFGKRIRPSYTSRGMMEITYFV